MRILLSNDDGILAPGLAALYGAVADMGEVTVAAPDSPQSAAGHAITIRNPLTVHRVEVDGPPPFRGFSVAGRPADCVRLAVRSLMDAPAELVVTGLNAGSNVGINVFYSGTVAAAAEAAMLGLPAVAFSAETSEGETDFAAAAGMCGNVLRRLLDVGLGPGELINVNIPLLAHRRPAGVRVVAQSTAGIEDTYHRDVAHDGSESYRLTDEYSFTAEQENTDVVALAEGYITVTPLHVDMTDHKRLDDLARIDWDNP
ncbi:MAG: 5'/3'-nucleotidase SurE [Phycisphaerae bacterium]